MRLIDTHTHLYLENFNSDRDEMLNRAISNGIDTMLLPNIDRDSFDSMLDMCGRYEKTCFPMIGLHPGSVGKDVNEQLQFFENAFSRAKFIAIGEIGIDLFWDRTFRDEQVMAFKTQLEWAKKLKLPAVIHTREAFPLVLDLVEQAQDGTLKGVFHCFSGTAADAKRIIDLNFYIGVGGVITYKKSALPEVIKNVPLQSILLETDAPFLPPVPHRGKRNESAYLIEIAAKLADIKQVPILTISESTTHNAQTLFNLH